MTTALYARISSDPRDSRLGVDRQLTSARDLAARLELPAPVEEYVDNDKSAAALKARPAFAQLLEDAAAGRVTAVVAWDQDRLTRDLEEWAAFRRTMNRRSVALALVNAGGLVDLASPGGGLTTGIRAVLAEQEVEVKAARQRAWAADRARRGLPHGSPAYGYLRVATTDRLGYRVASHDEPDPTTAPVVVEIATRLLAGDTVRGIAADLTTRGIPSPGGGRWTTRGIRRVVTNPVIAGRRRHNGEVITDTQAAPILDPDVFDRVSALLADPSRRTSPPGNTPAHLLSGIARCGVCGEPMRATAGRYRCPVGHVGRVRPPVDEWVTDVVTGRLAQADAVDLFTAPSVDLTQLRDQVATLRARLDLAADDYAAGTLDAASWRRVRDRVGDALDKAQADLAAALQQAGRPEVLAGVTGPDARARFDALPLERRRAVVRLLVDVVLLPVGKADGQRQRWHGFDVDSVRITWRTP